MMLRADWPRNGFFNPAKREPFYCSVPALASTRRCRLARASGFPVCGGPSRRLRGSA